MGNGIDEFYDYLNNNGYEERSLEIIGTLYEYMDSGKLAGEKEKEALSLLYDGFYNSDPNDTWRFAYLPEKKRALILSKLKEIINNVDMTSESSISKYHSIIKNIASRLNDMDYDEILIDNPDYKLYSSPTSEELAAFFESLDEASDMIRLFLEIL